MKPLQIGLLVIAGALGGAVVMKVLQRPPQPVVLAPAPGPAVAQVETPAPPPVGVPPPEVKPSPAPPPEPAPEIHPKAPVTRVTRTPARGKVTSRPAYHSISSREPRPQPARQPDPVVVAKSEPPAAAPPSPAPPPPPPARTEPEHVTPAPAPAPEPEPRRVTLNAGTLVPVRLVDGLSSERNGPGDAFTGTLDKELVADGFVIAERGARVAGRVVSADRGGKVKGVATLAVALTSIRTSDGQSVAIQTDTFERRAEASQNTDAAKIAGGAAVGAIIGAIAGGGKGAAVGAGAGGGAGAGDVLLTRGKPATLPSETRLSFRLSSAVTVTEQR